MSSIPFYKKAAATPKGNFDWPPKRIERPVRVARQEPPPPPPAVEEERQRKKKIHDKNF